ncbi:Polyketide cyclase / dehydrase and lipid transport [Marinactinospora thermotolerans DSM 45154]|uniref:Polyketide cyclase / dehydrase and lipid transport n=1 Tax=Marinactinospora thermotolerans DSM 45154 TaxID=1122192 RepID=A0A1T4PIV2_9ACTN|nr:SRPBCC family protein [Marinactinospora thermotolerans]SJZ91382.1 Polyketide cyclase / dehydrase and lipid transport [Marinactinospora thermotolerans DSM 45154]
MFDVEGRSSQSEIHVAAAPGRVWDAVTDIALPAGVSPELRGVEWLGGATRPEEGARFAGHNHHPAIGEWRTVSQIVEFTPPRVFAWAVMDADGRFGPPAADVAERLATWRFELVPEGDGTRLRYCVRIGPGRSGLVMTVERFPDKAQDIVAGRLRELRAGIEATLRAVKERCERPGS